MNERELSDLVMRELITLSAFTEEKRLAPLVMQHQDSVELGYEPLQVLAMMKERYTGEEKPMFPMELALHPCYMQQRNELRKLLHY